MPNNTTCISLRMRVLATAILMILTMTVANHVEAGPSIMLRTADGRTLEGEVEFRTDANRLWLLFRTRSAELRRPIAWKNIVEARLGGESLTAVQLRHLLLKTPDAEPGTTGAEFLRCREEMEIGSESPPTPRSVRSRTIATEALEILFAPQPAPALSH